MRVEVYIPLYIMCNRENKEAQHRGRILFPDHHFTLDCSSWRGRKRSGFWRDAPKIYLQISWVWLIMVDLPWDTPPSIDTGSDTWWTPSLRMIGPFKAFASQCLPRHELLSNIQYLRNDQYDHINDNYGWFWVSVPFLASIFQSMLLSHSHSHDNWLTSSWLPHKATESSPCYRTGRQLGSNYGFFATNLKLAVLVPKIHWSATQNEANA